MGEVGLPAWVLARLPVLPPLPLLSPLRACRIRAQAPLRDSRAPPPQVGRPLVTDPHDAILRVTSSCICGSGGKGG